MSSSNNEIKFTKLFINGRFVDSLSGKTFETINPATEKIITRVAEGRKEDVDLAVNAARYAFDHGPWPRMSGEARGRIIMRFANLIEEHADELATLDALDGGNVFSVVRSTEIPFASGIFHYYAGTADKISGATLKMSSSTQAYTLREPIGVVGHIVPWNFGLVIFALKVAPALAVGCPMVIKAAEQTPLTCLSW